MHSAVAEVAIFGVPDRTWGEVGVCVCVLGQGAQLNERELLTWLETRVARYKLPKRVFFWDELPKTGYGKISKRLLMAELEARGCLPRAAAERASA
jgi:acyl-CoA synthetase (AMP-forming)/AMP-acid ligase II